MIDKDKTGIWLNKWNHVLKKAQKFKNRQIKDGMDDEGEGCDIALCCCVLIMRCVVMCCDIVL